VSTDDERHQAGPGERRTADQANKQDELDGDATTDSQEGAVGEAIRRASEKADDQDHHDEVGDAIRRSGDEP
jgi:hypothetical protein